MSEAPFLVGGWVSRAHEPPHLPPGAVCFTQSTDSGESRPETPRTTPDQMSGHRTVSSVRKDRESGRRRAGRETGRVTGSDGTPKEGAAAGRAPRPPPSRLPGTEGEWVRAGTSPNPNDRRGSKSRSRVGGRPSGFRQRAGPRAETEAVPADARRPSRKGRAPGSPPPPGVGPREERPDPGDRRAGRTGGRAPSDLLDGGRERGGPEEAAGGGPARACPPRAGAPAAARTSLRPGGRGVRRRAGCVLRRPYNGERSARCRHVTCPVCRGVRNPCSSGVF